MWIRWGARYPGVQQRREGREQLTDGGKHLALGYARREETPAVPRALSLRSMRLSILAAAGLGAVTCADERLNPVGYGGATTASGSGGATGSSGSGGAGSVAASSGAGGDGGLAPGDAVCAGATPIPATNGMPSGFAQCPDGTIHRNQAVACDPTIAAPVCNGHEKMITCASDAECTAGPHGRCVSVEIIDAALTTVCGCFYSCANDAECGAGKVCVCGGVVTTQGTWAVCAPATCVTGADCASGNCGISSYIDNCVIDVQVGCRSPTDVCHVDDDCATDGGAFKRCVLTSTGSWACKPSFCIMGRPLLIDGRARAAPVAARDDWARPVRPELASLDRGARAALAQRWLEVAALEHASVASFARFTLDLLALGAPAALVGDAQRAALDEVEHARLAYGLASAYAGRALGPGPIDLGALRLTVDRREMVQRLIEEACIGETLGVAEATALAERARDPALVGVHRRIAADELRHAELAWRTLAWLLDGADAATRSFAARCFEQAGSAAARDPEPRGVARPESGLLGARELGTIRRQALREVVAPCAAALMAHLRVASPAPLLAAPT